VTRFAVPRSRYEVRLIPNKAIKTVLKSPRFILKNLFDEVSLDLDSVKNIQSEDSLEKNLTQIGTIKELSKILTPREKDVLNRRYYEDQTREEIGKVHSVTRGQLRDIEVNAFRKLRRQALKLGYGGESHVRLPTWQELFKAGQKVRDLWED